MDKCAEPWPAEIIVYYDGDCALCNWSVARCLARGVPPEVRFAPQDGALFGRLVDLRPDLAGEDSMVIQSFRADDCGRGGSQADAVGRIRLRSEAVIWLASRLRGPERWLAALRWVAPRALLDWGYRQVAKNRRRLGRRLAECPVPTPEQRRYFLA